MNSKSTTFVIFVICIVLLTSTGCKDDPTEPEAPVTIVGSWQLTRKENSDSSGNTIICEGDCIVDGHLSYTFNEDGTGTSVGRYEEIPITWLINSAGDLRLYYLDGGLRWIYSNYTLSACEFRTVTEWDQGGSRVEVFTKTGANCN